MDKSRRDKTAKRATRPKACPACGGKIAQDDRILRKCLFYFKKSTFRDKKDVLFASIDKKLKIVSWTMQSDCTNRLCSGQELARIIFFASKNGMDIGSLGEKRIKFLYESGKVKGPADLYRLTETDLMTIDKVKQKSAAKMLESIKATARNNTLAQVIHSMGIPFCGLSSAELLATKANSLEGLLALTENDLQQIPGMSTNLLQTFNSRMFLLSFSSCFLPLDFQQQVSVPKQLVYLLSI